MHAWDYIASAAAQPGFKKIEDYFHLLITDIEMPQMDGLHLIKKIKADPKLRHLPCIVFSSMISPELAVKVKALGADGQITKPEIHTLVNLVDQKVLP